MVSLQLFLLFKLHMQCQSDFQHALVFVSFAKKQLNIEWWQALKCKKSSRFLSNSVVKGASLSSGEETKLKQRRKFLSGCWCSWFIMKLSIRQETLKPRTSNSMQISRATCCILLEHMQAHQADRHHDLPVFSERDFVSLHLTHQVACYVAHINFN